MLKFTLYLTVLLLSLMACNAETTSYKEKQQHIQFKPHAPVEMAFSLPAKIKVDEELAVQITFKSDVDVEDIIVKFHTNSNLKFVSEKKYHLGMQPSFQSNTLVVTVIPQNEGLFYINVSATLVNNGKHQTRSFAIPVNVGNVQTKLKINGVQQDSTSGGIISMPAVETAE